MEKLGTFCPILPYKHMGKKLTSRIFYKMDQTNLKLGVMITWVNSKTFIAISTSLDGIDFPNHGHVHVA